MHGQNFRITKYPYFGDNRDLGMFHEVSETEIIYQVKASKDDRIDAN